MSAPAGAPSVAVWVLGAGAWGTAFAVRLAQRGQGVRVGLWGRDPDQILDCQAQGENRRYLPGHRLPESLALFSGLDQALAEWRSASGPRLLVLATPVAGLSELAEQIRVRLGAVQAGEGVVCLSKGIAKQDNRLVWPSTILSASLPGWRFGTLSGPSFADEVARGLPFALTLASKDIDWARQTAKHLHGNGLRIYSSADLVGVELGGAIKNVLAIAAGALDQLGLGGNARAALITRGLAEAARLGRALGAQPETFLGLAALGDLVLTCTGDLSRNRRVGMGLAKGESLEQVLQSLGHVAEGVRTAPVMLELARSCGVEVPITAAVNQVLEGRQTVVEAIEGLMARGAVDESNL